MALDPNASPPVSSWSLGALGAPSASTTPLAPKSMQFTPEQIAQMRREAMTLQEPPKQGITHWTQGLAELVRAIQGNREADFARKQEQQGRQQGAEAAADILSPFLSPGGGPQAAGGIAPAGASVPAGASPSTTTAGPTGGASGGSDDPRGMEPYIRETAQKYGIDPDTAVKVARSEGLREFLGDGGKSGGAFQLYTGGGMGNDFQKETGLDPLDPKNEKATIDYALKNVPKVGWTPFHGARKVGIGARDGIRAEAETGQTGETGAPTPTGLLAPFLPPDATPDDQASAASSSKMAYAADTSDGLPSEITRGGSAPRDRIVPRSSVFDTGAPPVSNLSPFVNAIAGRPVPPISAAATPPITAPLPGEVPDFGKQAAALAADRGPAVPLSPDAGAAVMPTPPANADFASRAAALADRSTAPSVPLSPPIPPADFARQAAALAALRPAVPGGVPAPAAAPPPPPAPADNTVPVPIGSAIPGAVGPTSVGGAPLVPPGTAPTNAAMLSAIAGRAVPPAAAVGGAPNQPASIQVAQNGMPTAAAPTGPAAAVPSGPSGLPTPLLPPTAQITREQLTRMLANPWIPENVKANMLQMIQQRGQVQSLPMEGGIYQYDASGRSTWIPQTVYKTMKVGDTEVTMAGTRASPNAPMQWKEILPSGNQGATPNAAPSAAPAPSPTTEALPHPAQPQGASKGLDLSTIGGIRQAQVEQAGAKKGAEVSAEARAKYLDSLKKGVLGTAMIASQQKVNLDGLDQVANSPDLITGTWSEGGLALQRMAASIGINEKAAAPRELFNMLAARILGDQIAGLKSIASETGEVGGRIFKPMLDIEEKSNITPEDSIEGIKAKIALFQKMGDLAIKYGNMADAYIQQHGAIDENFDHQLRQEIANSRLPNIVPPNPRPEASTAPKVGGPAVGTVDSGFRFKGGDPNKKENWEKVR